jgi:hypothetical protein
MLLHEYVCRGLCFQFCSTFRFHEMSSSQCYVHRDVALWAMRLFRHHRRYDDLCHLMFEQFQFFFEVSGTDSDFCWGFTGCPGSYISFVDSCVVFWTTQDRFAQFDFMRSLIVLRTFQGTRFTCDDFNWGVEWYLWLLQGISAQGGVCCIVFRNLFTCCTMEGVLMDYGVPTVLDVAHLQLYFVSAKKKSCLPLYIVQGSHRIEERESFYILMARRGSVLSCIVILLQL